MDETMLSGRVSRSRRVQGRAGQPDPVYGDRVRQAGGPVQRDIPGFIVIGEKPGRDAVMATMLRHHLTPPRPPGGHRGAGGLPGLRQTGVYRRAEHLRVPRPARPSALRGRFPHRYQVQRGSRCGRGRRCRGSAGTAGGPSCLPSGVNSDRIWASFLRCGPGTALSGPRSGGQAGAGRNGDACPGGDSRAASRRCPGWGSSGPQRVGGDVAEAAGELPEPVDVGEGGDQAE